MVSCYGSSRKLVLRYDFTSSTHMFNSGVSSVFTGMCNCPPSLLEYLHHLRCKPRILWLFLSIPWIPSPSLSDCYPAFCLSFPVLDISYAWGHVWYLATRCRHSAWSPHGSSTLCRLPVLHSFLWNSSRPWCWPSAHQVLGVALFPHLGDSG